MSREQERRRLVRERDRWNIFDEISAERVRQDAKFGEQNPPDVPRSRQLLGLRSADEARDACDLAFRTGHGTWAHILVEEVCEAVDASSNDAELRAELVQVAAVTVAWIEALGRRGVPRFVTGRPGPLDTEVETEAESLVSHEPCPAGSYLPTPLVWNGVVLVVNEPAPPDSCECDDPYGPACLVCLPFSRWTCTPLEWAWDTCMGTCAPLEWVWEACRGGWARALWCDTNWRSARAAYPFQEWRWCPSTGGAQCAPTGGK